MTIDDNREGFRILRSEPSLLPMELLWRWSFGLGLMAALFFGYTQLREAMLVYGAGDILPRYQEDTSAYSAALADAITQAFPLILPALAKVAALVALLWIASATVGRAAITRLLVRRYAREYGLTITPHEPRWQPFAMLKTMRVLMLLIIVIGYLGGGLLASFAVRFEPGLAVFVMIQVVCLAVSGVLWSYVNWVLSLAPIFVVRDGLAPVDAVVEAIAFVRRQRSRLFSIALWNSSVRSIIALLITIAAIATGAILTGRVSATLLVVETLAYLVLSDAFLLARLASYSAVAVRELATEQVPAGAELSSGSSRR